MDSETNNGRLLAKTLELCQTIIDQQEYQVVRKNLDAFLTNDEAQQLYRSVAEKGEHLQHKQQQGQTLAEDEIADFEKSRETMLENEVARQFLSAQQEMQEMHQTVSRYVMKSLELGRVASAADFETCGSGCSCGH